MKERTTYYKYADRIGGEGMFKKMWMILLCSESG